MPDDSALTDDKPGPGPPELTVTPADALNPMLAPTAGVRSWVDAPRQYERGRPPGVDRDVETHASCATCTDPGEGDQLLDASGDPRLVPGGAAEVEFAVKSARHRPGTWPRHDAVVIDIRDIREGRYGPRSGLSLG
jgi:hypothetical protein